MADVRPRADAPPAPRRASDEMVGRVLAGRYRLRGVVGAGASGRVYEADDIQLRRRVAVKVLHQGLADDRGFLQRFRAEAQVAASLHHRNILVVHDWGEDDTAFMVMELLDGGSLRAILDAGIRLSPAQAARLGRDVAEALDYAHSRGIVHRDIKPANLLFDEHAVVRIADFGLARALAEASWTEPAGAVFGTARYASPEQARGVPLDARSDLYSLALVLYEAVAGTVPFASDTVMGSLAARTQQPITAPVEWGPLRAVIERAGRIDADDRYPDAATMVAALRDACDTLGRPEPLPIVGVGGGVLADPHPTLVAPRAPSASPAPVADEPVIVDASGVIDLRDDVDPVANAAAVEHSSTPRTAPLFDQDAVPSLFDQDAPSSSGRGDDGIRTFDASDTAPRRTPRSGRVISIVVAVALVAALAGAGYALASTLGGTRVVVPGLVGYSEAEARALAESADVDVRVERRESDDPEGVVIDQRPAAGERSSGSVTVIVSSGPPPIAAPELIGLGRKAATAAATDAGLVPEVVQAFDERAPVGRVIAQDPGVGEPAARDSTIRITVSQGPAPRPVPPVGADVDDARAALQEQGFTVGEVQEFSDTVDEGDVIETRPGSGTEAPFGSEVVLVVSKGPELVGVPNVFGQSLESACREIRGLGLECDVENFVEGGRVQNQEPQPGEKVERGTSVTIYL